MPNYNRNSLEDIIHRFTYHPPNEKRGELHEQIRAKFLEFALDLVALCPESRELSLSLTNLEQAQFWANAAVARNIDQEES